MCLILANPTRKTGYGELLQAEMNSNYVLHGVTMFFPAYILFLKASQQMELYENPTPIKTRRVHRIFIQ